MLFKLRNCKPAYLTFAVCLNRAAKTKSLLVGPSEKSRERPAMTTWVANQDSVHFAHSRRKKGGSQPYDKHVSGNLRTYPSPKPTFCPKWEVSFNVDLGKGWLGSFPRNVQWSHCVNLLAIVSDSDVLIARFTSDSSSPKPSKYSWLIQSNTVTTIWKKSSRLLRTTLTLNDGGSRVKLPFVPAKEKLPDMFCVLSSFRIFNLSCGDCPGSATESQLQKRWKEKRKDLLKSQKNYCN